MKKTNKDNRKFGAGFAFLAIALVAVLGFGIAFFSDYITGSGDITAGTLNLTGSYTFKQNGGASVTTVPNFNPGDVVTVEATVTNTGNKSAWIRDVIDFGTIDPDIAEYIKIYAGVKTAAQIEAAPTTDVLTLTAGKFVSVNKIIDGTGTAAETETGADALGTNVKTVAYTVYFDKAALNKAQGKAITFVAKTQAIQYRNNTTAPNWDAVTIELLP